MRTQSGAILLFVGIFGLVGGCVRSRAAQVGPEKDMAENVEKSKQAEKRSESVEPDNSSGTESSSESSREQSPETSDEQPEENSEVNPMARRGEELFEKQCASCHGEDARGARVGPSLRPIASELSRGQAEPVVRQQITEGGERMPSFSHLEKGQVNALVAYLTVLGDESQGVQSAGTERAGAEKNGG